MVFGSRKKQTLAPLGYKAGFEEQYELQDQAILGKGGNGVVRLARHKATGEGAGRGAV